MKKGQMSLEMIIGLLILLVVAVVVIRMFIGNIEGINEPEKGVKDKLKSMGFYSECESLCSNYLVTGTRANLAKYCYTRMEGDTDLNDNGLVDTIQADTKILDICEDMVYCFHVVECETDYGKVDWDDCRDVVCASIEDDYPAGTNVDAKFGEFFPGVGTCDLRTQPNNWWETYFGGGCTGTYVPASSTTIPAAVPSCIDSVTSCEFESGTSTFTCIADVSDPAACDSNQFILLVKDQDTTDNVGAVGNLGASYLGSVSFTSNQITGTYQIMEGTQLQDPTCDSSWYSPHAGTTVDMGIEYGANRLITFDTTNCNIN